MKRFTVFACLLLAATPIPAMSQEKEAPGLGEVVVTANRLNARYAQQDRPVIGLRRQADSAVMTISFSSDSRDEETRKKEIYAMLQSAMDRAATAGVELVTGNFELVPVTKANYQELPMWGAGRPDTSKVDVMVKVKLAGSTNAADKRIEDFAKSIPKTGRGAVDRMGGLTLTIINPDQYRQAIIELVAEDGRRQAAVFGADYAVQVSGIDGQLFWSQVSGTDVFLYIPYRYTIVPK
jgi:hypothetical protein